MTDDQLDAHLVALGYRVVCRVTSEPGSRTDDELRAFFGGDLSALRDVAALAGAARKNKQYLSTHHKSEIRKSEHSA